MPHNQLVLKTVNDLLDENFYVPAYQRGYRWKKQQIESLLEDIWSFKIDPPQYVQGEEKPFYCLQPIVVKKREIDTKKCWEVIDGQQRLTTIFIILNHFNLVEYVSRPKKLFNIRYQTRKNCNDFFQQIDNKKLAEKYIDSFYIYEANQVIENWFNERENDNDAIRHDFRSVLINDVKVIWYEADSDSSDKSNTVSIDIFTRLNIGKIPLTNAELIKALFLRKGNFQINVNLRQLQIASEWDAIEKVLQNDSFWYFLYSPNDPVQYDNRIEYIFDLMTKKTKHSEQYYTFHIFNNNFSKSKKEKGQPDIDDLWLKVKKYFLTFEEWYNNRELYHLVGFVIDCGHSISKLKTKSEKGTKTDFKNYLHGEIRKQINCNIDNINYRDKHVKKILLFFNIQTILATENTDIRFPFFRYKDEQWDIEHVRSQTDKKISGNTRKDWALDVLEFLTGEKGYSNNKGGDDHKSPKDVQLSAIKLLEEPDLSYSKSLIQILDSEKINDEEFDKLHNKLTSHLDSKASENIDSISNLALLDSATNRSYKNAMFPIKRKIIIENDMNGVFVPICTKNLFLKSYSKKVFNIMQWDESDAKDYLEAIKETLKDYLPTQEKKHE